MTEGADLERLGIGVRADPKPLRMPGEEPRRRRARIFAWLLIGVAVAGVAGSVALAVFAPAPK